MRTKTILPLALGAAFLTGSAYAKSTQGQPLLAVQSSSIAADTFNSYAVGYQPGMAAQTNYPLQFLQLFGPTSAAAQQSLVGRVSAMWSSGYTAQPGVFSISYAPAYRLYFMP